MHLSDSLRRIESLSKQMKEMNKDIHDKKAKTEESASGAKGKKS